MIRGLCSYFLAIVALVSVAGVVCEAQSLTPLTRQVRENAEWTSALGGAPAREPSVAACDGASAAQPGGVR